MENNQKSKLCWYCEKNNAKDEYAVQYDMHKLVKRKGSYAVFGRLVKTEYLTKSINIPRCKHCAKIHSKLVSISLIIYLICCSLFIWQVIILNETNATDQKIIGSIMVLVFGSPVFLLISWIINKISGVKENIDENFPPVAKLLIDGWEGGTTPYLKGNDYNSE